MDSIKHFFSEYNDTFTVYVVEQRFFVGRGHEYFSSFKGTDNIIDCNESMKKRIYSVLGWIQKRIPNIAELVKSCCNTNPIIGITDVIMALNKLFSIQEHQAVGPEVIDPIIIQEGEISQNLLDQLISLHKSSVLQPVIIIALKDNNFERAKHILSTCPNGINIKFIRNSGECEMYKVVNTGMSDIDSFIDAYANQCFSSCSRTHRDILLNNEWADNSLVRKYSPLIFKIRSNLLYDEKIAVKDDIDMLVNNLQSELPSSNNETAVIQNIKCISNLFKVYCNDCGGKTIHEALDIAKELKSEVLLAHVYRYSHFLTEYNNGERRELLSKARQIFSSHNMADNAIYCENNNLLYDFYTNTLSLRRFKSLQEEAVSNVPGLVGMSIIFNNTGVAHLYKGEAEDAVEYFDKGLQYSKDRPAQKAGLLCNRLIAKDYLFETIDESEFRRVLNYIFDNFGTTTLPFITANNVMNILNIVLKSQPALYKEFLVSYPLTEVLQNALTPNQLGSGSLSLQLAILKDRYSKLELDGIAIPKQLSSTSGIRLSFLKKYGCNPAISNAWL